MPRPNEVKAGNVERSGTLELYEALTAIYATLMLLGICVYVLNALCTMRILKAANHRYPAAAWVPFWNTVVLLELGGIRGAWAWVGLLYGASNFGSIIPFLGIVIMMAAIAMLLVTQVWYVRAIQEATGLQSVAGIVLSFLVPPAWIVWMAIRVRKTGFNRARALEIGATFPFPWFQNVSDPQNAFRPEPDFQNPSNDNPQAS